MSALASLVAAETTRWPSDLERVLFGTDDPEAIAAFFDAHARVHLGAAVVDATFYARSVGAVAGVALADGTRAVLKAHRLDLVHGDLDAVHDVQAALAAQWHAVPAPRHRPTRHPSCVVTAEALLDDGAVADAHEPAARRALARGLAHFVALGDGGHHRSLRAPHALSGSTARWPVAHDLRFDLTAAGGEWIDDLADAARRRLLARAPALPSAIAHLDWRVQNLRVRGAEVVAVFDWDSVVAAPGAFTVGANAMAFTADWSRPAPFSPYPTVDEMRAFVSEVEDAMGRSFHADEREVLDAANLHALCYVARCQHSDDVGGRFPDRGGVGFPELLRARGERLWT